MEGATVTETRAATLSPGDEMRRRWMSVLARASASELESAVTELRARSGELPGYRLIRRPETGMAMVRGRAGGTGRVFNLGEITMTRCTLQTSEGCVGSSHVASRDRRQAELAALFDALLQNPARQREILQRVVEPLAREQARRRDGRMARSAATRVDFFTVVRGEDRP